MYNSNPVKSLGHFSEEILSVRDAQRVNQDNQIAREDRDLRSLEEPIEVENMEQASHASLAEGLWQRCS